MDNLNVFFLLVMLENIWSLGSDHGRKELTELTKFDGIKTNTKNDNNNNNNSNNSNNNNNNNTTTATATTTLTDV